jgi:hypothetical protein
MTAIALPHLRKRKRSKPAQAAAKIAKVWTAVKVASMAARTARKSAKGYGKVKGRAKFLVVPIAAGGGIVALKKFRSSGDDEPATPYGSGVGPAAEPSTVTPPKTAPGSAVNGEGAMSSPPAGSENPATS